MIGPFTFWELMIPVIIVAVGVCIAGKMMKAKNVGIKIGGIFLVFVVVYYEYISNKAMFEKVFSMMPNF